MTPYRTKKGHDTWHFCSNCPNYPQSDFDERDTKPAEPSGVRFYEVLRLGNVLMVIPRATEEKEKGVRELFHAPAASYVDRGLRPLNAGQSLLPPVSEMFLARLSDRVALLVAFPPILFRQSVSLSIVDIFVVSLFQSFPTWGNGREGQSS